MVETGATERHLPVLEALGNIGAGRRLSVGRDMQKADTQGRMGSSPMARSGPSPFVAFAVAAVLALVGLGVWFFAAQGEAPKPAPAPQTGGAPAEVLTEAEAIAEFERLRSSAEAALKSRSESSLSSIFVPNSPVLLRARKEIRELTRKDVTDQSRYLILSSDVLSLTKTSFAVREEMRIEPCFVAESGKNVSSDNHALFQIAVWSVKSIQGEWLLFDAEIEESRRLSEVRRDCP